MQATYPRCRVFPIQCVRQACSYQSFCVDDSKPMRAKGQSSSTGSCKLTTNAHRLKREIVTQYFTQYFFHRAFIPRYYSGPYLLKKKIQGFPNCSPLSEHTSQGKKNYTRNTETLKKADINISKQSISGGGRDGQTLRLDWEKYSASMSAPFNGANCGCSGAPAAAMELLRVAESRNEMVLALPMTTISFLLRGTFWSCNLVVTRSACSPPPNPSLLLCKAGDRALVHNIFSTLNIVCRMSIFLHDSHSQNTSRKRVRSL